MNSRTTRIIKEARGLCWPWCGVMIAAALPWLFGQNVFTALGLLVGIPLLASLSLGNEFRHRTLSLLLSQPVDRMRIWDEKLSVMIIAAVSPALVFWSGFRFGIEPWPLLHEYWVVAAGSWFIITVGSATFWTLFSRSAMGGLALNVIQSSFIVVGGLILTSSTVYPNLSSTEGIVALAIYAFATMCYAGVMLWLGRRKLAQFQVWGGIAGDDLLLAGPNMMPQALAGLFRCRPAGASLNLIRKELRLLRPLWLVTLLFVLCGICLRITAWFIPHTGETRFDFRDSVVLA